MSYVAKKTRVFKGLDDPPEVLRKRSEGRMKTYPSATDTRAWAEESEDRRTHILDLIKEGGGKSLSLGRYVPIEVLIDTLLANKNADIERLRRQVEELQAMLDNYSKLNLSEEQKQQLAQMKGNMGKIEDQLGNMSSQPGTDTTAGTSGVTAEVKLDKIDEITPQSDVSAEIEEPIAIKTTAKVSEVVPPNLDSYGKEELKQLIIEKDAEIIALKNAVAAKEDECGQQRQLARTAIEKLETLKDIIDERDHLKKKLADSQHEIETLRKQQTGGSGTGAESSVKQDMTGGAGVFAPAIESCAEEISVLENEIERLRNGGELSPAQETEVIRKEVAVLKKYCAKLSSIQEENVQLKRERDALKKQIGSGGGSKPYDSTFPSTLKPPTGTESPDSISHLKSDHESLIKYEEHLGSLRSYFTDDCDESDDKAFLKNRLVELEDKLKTFNATVEERDKLRARVTQLESELSQFGQIPEEIEIIRERSRILDDIIVERDSLHTRLNKMKGLEDELLKLKKKATRVDELEKQIEALRKQLGQTKRSSQAEICGAKNQKDNIYRELENVKAERDMLRMKLADTATQDQEIERLRYRAKEAEVLRIERDRMKIRLDELAAVEVEFMQLLDRTKCIESIKAEREMYKSKYEELLGLECECDMLRSQVERAKSISRERDSMQQRLRECECCICDQENEINKLLSHIDRLSAGHEEQQERMKQSLMELRNELDKKNNLIGNSEQQLAVVQNQLKTTIADVTSETSNMKQKVEQLEKQSIDCEEKLKEKQEQIDFLHDHLQQKTEALAELGKEKVEYNELIEAFAIKDQTIEQLKKDLQECRLEVERLQGMATPIPLKEIRSSLVQTEAPEPLEQALIQTEQSLEQAVAQTEQPVEQAVVQTEQPLVAEPILTQTKEQPVIEVAPVSAVHSTLIDQLEQKLQMSRSEIERLKELANHIETTATDTINHLKKDLKASQIEVENLLEVANKVEKMTSDRHLQTMLEQSKTALKRVAEEISEPIKKWECRALRRKTMKRTCGGQVDLTTRKEKEVCDAFLRQMTCLRQVESDLKDKLKKSDEKIEKLEATVVQSERISAENSALRKHSSEVQEVAKEQITELADHIRKSQEKITRLESENNQLKKESILKVKETDSCEELRRELEEMMKQKGNLEDMIKKMQGDIGGSAAQLNSLREEYRDLEMQLEKEIKLRQAAEQRIKELEAEIARLLASGDSEELDQLRKENTKLKEDLKNALDALEREKNRSVDRMNNLSKQIDTMADKVQERDRKSSIIQRQLEAQLNDLKEEKDRLANDNERLKGDNNRLKSEADKLREENDKMRGENDKLRGELDDLRRQLAALKKASEDSSEADDLRKQLEDLRKSSGSAQKDWEDQLKKLQAEIDRLQKENGDLKKEIDNLTKASDNLAVAAAEKAAMSKELDDTRKQLDDARRELDELRRQLEALTKKNEELSLNAGDSSKLQSQIANLLEQLEELKKTAGADAAALKACLEEKEKLLQQIEGQKKQISDLIAQTQIPVDDTDKLELERERKEKQALEDMLKNLQDQLNKMREEAENRLKDTTADDLAKQLEDALRRAKEAEAALALLKKQQEDALALLKKQHEDALALLKKQQEEALQRAKQAEAALAKLKQDKKDMEDQISRLKEQVKAAAASTGQPIPIDDSEEWKKKLKALQEELDKQKKECQDTIAALKSQYDRDIKNLHTKHNDSIAKLQNAHEEVVKEVSKELEKEVESLRQELVSNKEEISSVIEKKVEPDDKGDTKCTCGKEFENLMKKILEKGIESLNFQELQYLHTKTCEATAKLLGRGDVPSIERDNEVCIPERDEPKSVPVPATPPTEKDLIKRSKNAQSQVARLQVEINLERQRLEDLKSNLEMEKQTNVELVRKIRSQTKAVSNMQVERDLMKRKNSYHEEKLQKVIVTIEKERSKIRSLEDTLEKEKGSVKHLKVMLDNERENSKVVRRRDSEQLDILRLELEKTLKNEMLLRMTLEQNNRPKGTSSNPANQCAACPGNQSQPSGIPHTHTTSYYTELTVQDVNSKRNIVQQCRMLRSDKTKALTNKDLD